MDYKNKYNEALERARKEYKIHESFNGFREMLLHIFPELKESVDEKIRKELLSLIEWSKSYAASGITTDEANEMLAWLEKQGEQKTIERKDFISIPFGAFDSELIEESITIPDGCYATIEGNKIHIKKKDKSATEAIKLNHTVDNNEMVEATFKAGDWVVRRDGETFSNGNNFAQIKSIKFDGNMCFLDTGRWLYSSEIRHWTIADAKDGDILVASDKKPFIYNGRFNDISIGAYCGLGFNDEFIVLNKQCNWTRNKNIRPATKEQSDLLSQKLKEAGYGIG